MTGRWWLHAVVGVVAVLLVVSAAAVGTVLLKHERGDDGGTLPHARPGMRWVTYRDVAVQVPKHWDYGYEPGSDWCAGGIRQPKGPYVEVDPGRGMVFDILCAEKSAAPKVFGPAPERLWRSHVVLESAARGKDVGPARYDGWTLTSRTVGDVRVRLLTDDTAETEGILGSARTFDVDDHGCASTSSIQTSGFEGPDQPFDVRDVDAVDSISVCQYDRTVRDGSPGLMGSRSMEGRDAARLLAGLKAAPKGSGPNRPQSCTHDDQGDNAIDLVLHSGSESHHVFLYYATCFGNATTDGTTRRRLTARTCAPVFGTPVVAWEFSGVLRNVCSSPRR